MLWDRLEILRSIDSVIDFSRATAQLRILVILDDQPLTVDEIAGLTGLRRKTVLDALRKLELKGVVSRRDGRYVLSRKGKSIYEALKSIMFSESGVNVRREISASRPTLYDLYVDLLSVAYMLEVMKILGSRSDHRASVDELATKLGVSKSTLETHLRKFVEGKVTIFRRLSDKDSGSMIYELTDLGLNLYKRIFPRQNILSSIKARLRRYLKGKLL